MAVVSWFVSKMTSAGLTEKKGFFNLGTSKTQLETDVYILKLHSMQIPDCYVFALCSSVKKIIHVFMFNPLKKTDSLPVHKNEAV